MYAEIVLNAFRYFRIFSMVSLRKGSRAVVDLLPFFLRDKFIGVISSVGGNFHFSLTGLIFCEAIVFLDRRGSGHLCNTHVNLF